MVYWTGRDGKAYGQTGLVVGLWPLLVVILALVVLIPAALITIDKIWPCHCKDALVLGHHIDHNRTSSSHALWVQGLNKHGDPCRRSVNVSFETYVKYAAGDSVHFKR